MQLGLKLLENNLSAIRSRIDLEKAENEGIFQTVVIIVRKDWYQPKYSVGQTCG